VALTALLQSVAPHLFLVKDGVRPGGTLGNPQYLTGYLVPNFLLGLWLLRAWARSLSAKLWIGSGLAILVWAFALANTRGAVLGLGAGLLVLLGAAAYQKLRPFSWRLSVWRNGALLSLVAALLFFGLFFATKNLPFWQRLPVFDRLASISLADGSTTNRLKIWGIAADTVKERPLLGWGYDNFRYPYNLRYDPALFKFGSTETYWDKPHNALLEVAVTTGLVGLALYLYLIYVAIRALANPALLGRYGTAIIVGYLAQNLVSFDTFGSFFTFFILIGVAAMPTSTPVRKGPLEEGSRLATSVGIVLGITLAALSIFNAVRIFQANRAAFDGTNYLVQGYYKEGIESFRTAVRIKGPYQRDYRDAYLATLKDMAQKVVIPDGLTAYREAIAEMEKAIASDPANPFLYYALADAKNTFRQFDEELARDIPRLLDMADALSPNRQQHYYVRSRDLLLSGDLSGAVREMKRAVDLEPEAAEPHFYYGLLLLESEQDEGIDEILVAATLGRFPRSGTEARAAHTYFDRTNRVIDEINYFNDALDKAQLNGELNLEYRLALGAAYHKAVSYANARLVFEEVMMLDPQFKSGKRFEREYKKIFEDIGMGAE
jgi:tetratricopeptide (TPR) repeat protein